jgi:hypothetical protein
VVISIATVVEQELPTPSVAPDARRQRHRSMSAVVTAAGVLGVPRVTTMLELVCTIVALRVTLDET